MRIDLPLADAWLALCDQYRAALPFQEPALNVQVYGGYQHALWEITQSLAKLFSHKKTIALVEGCEPALESIAVAFSEEGYTVRFLKQAELENPGAWFAELQSELLFVLYAVDDPVTGEIFDCQKLQEILKDKRVFDLALSHGHHRFFPQVRPRPYEARVLSLRPDRSLMVAGERCRVHAPVAMRMPWRLEESEVIRAELEPFSSAWAENSRQLITELEADLPEGFRALLPKDKARLFDRALIFSPEFDGSAIRDEVAKVMQIENTDPGAISLIDATSPCRWRSPKILDWLLSRGMSEEQVRGALVISPSLIERGFRARLVTAAQMIRKLQNGSAS